MFELLCSSACHKYDRVISFISFILSLLKFTKDVISHPHCVTIKVAAILLEHFRVLVLPFESLRCNTVSNIVSCILPFEICSHKSCKI